MLNVLYVESAHPVIPVCVDRVVNVDPPSFEPRIVKFCGLMPGLPLVAECPAMRTCATVIGVVVLTCIHSFAFVEASQLLTIFPSNACPGKLLLLIELDAANVPPVVCVSPPRVAAMIISHNPKYVGLPPLAVMFIRIVV